MRLLYDNDELVVAEVSKHFGGMNFKPCTAIGLMNDSQLVGGVIFNNYHIGIGQIPVSICASVILLDKRELSRYIIRELFTYPFAVLRVGRLQVEVARKAKRVRKLVERLGFSFEGIARRAHPTGCDSAVYSMLPNECKWLNHGKFTFSPSTRPYSSTTNTEQPANSTLSSWA